MLVLWYKLKIHQNILGALGSKVKFLIFFIHLRREQNPVCRIPHRVSVTSPVFTILGSITEWKLILLYQ